MLKQPIALYLLTILFALNGCAIGSTVRAVSDYCAIAKPIDYDSTLDTSETVKQIELHNSQWVAVCEETPKP